MMLLHLFLFCVYLCLILVYFCLFILLNYLLRVYFRYIRWQHKNVVEVIMFLVLSFIYSCVWIKRDFNRINPTEQQPSFWWKCHCVQLHIFFSIYFICQLIIIIFHVFYLKLQTVCLYLSFSLSIYYTYISYNMISEFTTFLKWNIFYLECIITYWNFTNKKNNNNKPSHHNCDTNSMFYFNILCTSFAYMFSKR